MSASMGSFFTLLVPYLVLKEVLAGGCIVVFGY